MSEPMNLHPPCTLCAAKSQPWVEWDPRTRSNKQIHLALSVRPGKDEPRYPAYLCDAGHVFLDRTKPVVDRKAESAGS